MLVFNICIWTSWILWFCWPSGSFLLITISDTKQIRLYSNRNFQSQLSKKQECFFFNCPIKTKSLSDYSSVIWSCPYFQAKINGKKRPRGRFPRKSPWLGRYLPYFLLTKATKTNRGPNIDVYIFPWVRTSDVLCLFQCWKHPWISLDLCGYMFCYFLPLWVSVQKQTFATWNTKFS